MSDTDARFEKIGTGDGYPWLDRLRAFYREWESCQHLSKRWRHGLRVENGNLTVQDILDLWKLGGGNSSEVNFESMRTRSGKHRA